MDMFYVVVMELEQRGQSYAQDRATRVYDSPLPGIFLCSVISGRGTGKLRLRRRQSGCRQPVQAGGKMNQSVTSRIARQDFMLALTFMQYYKTT